MKMPYMEYSPAEILARGTIVKSNPVRKVLRFGSLYLKLDTRRGSSFRREFRAAQRLVRAGLPVVEHLAFGHLPEGAFLITRAWNDGATVQDYVEKNGASETFLQGFAAFLNKFYASRLWHGDLHWGNVLYDERRERFAFVDVRAVSASPVRRFLFGNRLRHIAMDLRAYLPRPRLLLFLKGLGIARPERWFLRTLNADILRINREWPRRQKQIRSGYPKFTVREKGKLWSVPRTAAAETAGAELCSGPQAEAIFLAHFYLQLMGIPHRRALWFDLTENTVAMEAIPAPSEAGRTLTSEDFSDWQNRLRRIGGESAPADWEYRNHTVFYRETADFARQFSATGGKIC